MKIFKFIILGLFSILDVTAFCQMVLIDPSDPWFQNKIQSDDLYNKGLKMFDQAKYHEADSLFTLSTQFMPFRDTYYNLALTKFHLGDTCGFCDNLKNADKLGDVEAEKLFNAKCHIKRKVNFKNNLHPDSLFYAFFVKSICTNKIVERRFVIKNIKSGSESIYNEITIDSSGKNLMNIPGSFPDLKNFDVDDTSIYSVTEIMPFFPGGDSERIKLIGYNILYPEMAKVKGTQGTVVIGFIIEKDGSLTNIKVVKGIGSGCDEETIRVVKLFPKWIPGIKSGKPVRVQYYMKIPFTLN
jgi:TonB family protein